MLQVQVKILIWLISGIPISLMVKSTSSVVGLQVRVLYWEQTLKTIQMANKKITQGRWVLNTNNRHDVWVNGGYKIAEVWSGEAKNDHNDILKQEANAELIALAGNLAQKYNLEAQDDLVSSCELFIKHHINILPPAEGAFFEDAHEVQSKIKNALKLLKDDNN